MSFACDGFDSTKSTRTLATAALQQSADRCAVKQQEEASTAGRSRASLESRVSSQLLESLEMYVRFS